MVTLRCNTNWDQETTEQNLKQLVFDSSPVAHVKSWRSPVLLIQGDDDQEVLFSQTVRLFEDLRNLGVEVEQLIFPDEAHEFLIYRHWCDTFNAAAEFFGRRLGIVTNHEKLD